MTELTTGDYNTLSYDEMIVGLEVARVGIGTVDYEADTLRLDPLSSRIFGLPANVDMPRAALHERVHEDDWPTVELEVDRLLDPEKGDVIDLVHRISLPDGSVRWVNARKKVRFQRSDGSPRPVSGVFAVVDVTGQKLAELQSQMLAGELNHRTKNLMTVIMSIARQVGRNAAPEEFQDRFMERLTALARNQDTLTKGQSHGDTLEAIIRRQLVPFGDLSQDRVTLDGPSVSVSASASMVLTMMVHELVTNAMKYGALSNETGKVEVRWRIAGDDRRKVDLRWQEHGGPPVRTPERKGYGTQVLTVLAEASFDAQVTLDYDEDGFRATVKAPLDRLDE